MNDKGFEQNEVKYDFGEHTEFISNEENLIETCVKPYNIFGLAGDLQGKNVIDIGCGDGIFCREASKRGAKRVLGIDNSQKAIDFCHTAYEKGTVENTFYKHTSIEEYQGDASHDIAILSYMINNAQNYSQLVEQLAKTASTLKKGGRAVFWNNNPFDVLGGAYKEFCWNKVLRGTTEGDEVFFICEGIEEVIINYYINPERHEQAFKEAGFSTFTWHKVIPSPALGEFWKTLQHIEHLPVICMTAEK